MANAGRIEKEDGNMSIFESILGNTFGISQPSCGFFQVLAEQRISYGFEPIDWPTIIINQFRAEALTRPMTVCEKLLYDGAIQAKNVQEKVKN